MTARLVALDEGTDIPLDRPMIVVGRHPQCDARLDSLRVSRHHCCMTQDRGELVVRDLGSTNGIRINGQRVEIGRLRQGDELSIAHIRYRLDNKVGQEVTLAESNGVHALALAGSPGRVQAAAVNSRRAPPPPSAEYDEASPLDSPLLVGLPEEQRLVAAVRDVLPSALAGRCRIQVIVQMPRETDPADEEHEPCRPDSSH